MVDKIDAVGTEKSVNLVNIKNIAHNRQECLVRKLLPQIQLKVIQTILMSLEKYQQARTVLGNLSAEF